jgi:hypothetical protein
MALFLEVISYRGTPPLDSVSARFDEGGGSIGRSSDNHLTLPDQDKIISRRHGDICYENGEFVPYSKQSNLLLFVEFPNYTGPPLNDAMAAAGKGKWIPMGAVKKMCERHCCSREGFTLATAKADTIHGFQGVTVGQGEEIKRILITWNKGAEVKFPGALYVSSSRSTRLVKIAFKDRFSVEDLKVIGSSQSWKLQHEEVERIVTTSEAQKNSDQAMNIGSTEHFIELIKWVISRGEENVASDAFDEAVKDTLQRTIDMWKENLTTLV